MKRVEDITSDGIQYIDEYGHRQFVDFQLCQANWMRYVQTSNEFPQSESLALGDSQGVGWRNFYADPPYIELFTDPPTRFTFPGINRWFYRFLPSYLHNDRNLKQFHQLQSAIIKAGWKTFDKG